MNHELKLTDPWWDRVKSGEKKSELRINDRDFQKGDTITFRHYPDGMYEEMYARITHVLPWQIVGGLDSDYAILSIELITKEEVAE